MKCTILDTIIIALLNVISRIDIVSFFVYTYPELWCFLLNSSTIFLAAVTMSTAPGESEWQHSETSLSPIGSSTSSPVTAMTEEFSSCDLMCAAVSSCVQALSALH